MLETKGCRLQGGLCGEAAAGAREEERAGQERDRVRSAVKTNILSVGKDDFCLSWMRIIHGFCYLLLAPGRFQISM